MNFKKVVVFVSVLLMTSTVAFAQEDYKITKDEAGNKMLVGKLNLQLLANDSAFSWFYQGVNNYEPNPNALDIIRKNKDNFLILAFMGTWNKASQEKIPALYRTLLSAGYPIDKIQLFGLDENLHSYEGADMNYEIDQVPTVIIYNKEGKRMGSLKSDRQTAVEQSLAALLQK